MHSNRVNLTGQNDAPGMLPARLSIIYTINGLDHGISRIVWTSTPTSKGYAIFSIGYNVDTPSFQPMLMHKRLVRYFLLLFFLKKKLLASSGIFWC
jgi:hypothetical protein